jgi:PAS domain S-box-containing protein
MDDGKKTKKELLGELAELRRRLAAADQDCQILVNGLREEHRLAKARWQQRVEDLELQVAGYAAKDKPPPSEVEECDSERERLLARVQERTEELQAANEKLHVQTEELQAANEELTIQTEELRVANEELTALNELLESRKQELELLARELETEHATLTAVVEQMPASVVIVKAPAGPILMSNKHAKHLFRQPQGLPADLESFWQIERYTPDGQLCEREDQPLWRSLTMGEVVLDEELSLRPAGRPPIHFSVSSAPVRDNEGRIVAGVATHFDITARKRAEETLRASEARYRNLVQLSPDAIIVHTDGKIVFLNAAAVKLTGANIFKDLLGRPIIDLVHPDDRDLVGRRVKQALSGGKAELQELRLVRLDGTAVDVETVGSGILYQGQPSVQVIIRDITTRKQAEAERERLLAERDRTATQLEAVLNSMSEGLIIADPKGKILTMNHAALALWGFESVDEVKRHLSEFPKIMDVRELSGEVVPWEEWPMAWALRGETFTNRELRLRRLGDGEEFICSYSGGPVRDKSGRSSFGVITIQVITARKQAEEALKESEARYRSIFENSHAVMVLLDPETGAIVDANSAACSYYGYSREEFQAKKVTDLNTLPPEQVFAAMRKARERQQEHFFFRHRLVSGEVRDVEMFSGSIRIKKQDLLFSIVHDVTARKQAEEALRHSNRRLDLLAETAGQLLASDSPQRVVDSLCHQVMDFLDCQAFFNFLVDENAERLHLNAYAGIPAEEAKRIEWLDYGIAVCGCAARDGCRIVTENIQTTPDPRTELVKSYGIRAYACHPLLMQGQVLGTLSFGTRTRDHFTPEELAMMKGVADQVAVAMDRKLTEEALRASEERERARAGELQAVLDAVPAFIWLAHDPNSHIITGNLAAYELLRLPPGENMSKTAPESEMPPHFRVMKGNQEIPYQGLPVQRAACGQTIQDFELDVVHDDGTTYNLLGNAVPLRDSAGQPRGSVAAFIDVTARKQAEEALRRAHDDLEKRVQERTTELRDTVAQLLEEVQERQEAQEALRKQAELLELAHEAIIVRDLDSRVTFWNRSAEEKYGWNREQALGRVTHDLLATLFPTSRGEVERELMETGHWQGEVVHTRADGEEIIISSRQALQRDEQGRPVAILEMNRNVTARRRAQAALRTERERLLALLERIPAYVSLLKQDRTFAYVNAEFIRRFGEPGTKHCYELKGLQNPCEECEAVAVFHSGKPLVRERVGQDGSFYQVHDYPFMDVDGSPLVLEMGVDITPRKRAEEQALSLGRMYRMLSKVNEAVVRVVGDRDELFRQTCRIMMEEGDFLLAWIGLVDPTSRLIRAAAKYNLNDEYIENLTIPYDDIPEGRGPTGTAVREGRYDVCNDYAADPRMAPWREQALARGFLSSAAFPLRVGSQVVGVLTVYAGRPGFFNTDEISLLESLADDLSLALDFMDKDEKRRRAEAALRESEERLRYLASQLLDAQENERRRLALELHDDLGQSLMVLKLQLRAIEKMAPRDQWQFREECTHCLNYLNGVIDNVRRLSRDLRPAVLEDLGLSSGLRVLAGDFCEYHEVELSLEIDDIEGLFSPDEEINIYRIFQETLTNIAKHAAAQQITLVISHRNNQVNFQVVDNGVGFDLEQVLARDPAKKGLGLAALEERVRMLGGKLTIRSQEHQGTEISFSVPISRKAEA